VRKDQQIRILRARLEVIPSPRRPHYPPAERLAILELRSRLGWSDAQTARELLLAPQTVASWRRRVDEQGPDALVQTREPVNAMPDFVTTVVHALHDAAPGMGRRKLAALLARAGLVLAASTVDRSGKKPRPPPAAPPPQRPREQSSAAPGALERAVTAKHPGHVFHIDLTQIPIPLSLPRMEAAIEAYRLWYNEHRPHTALGGWTRPRCATGRLPARASGA
jgi:transposase-like protein